MIPRHIKNIGINCELFEFFINVKIDNHKKEKKGINGLI